MYAVCNFYDLYENVLWGIYNKHFFKKSNCFYYKKGLKFAAQSTRVSSITFHYKNGLINLGAKIGYNNLNLFELQILILHFQRDFDYEKK